MVVGFGEAMLVASSMVEVTRELVPVELPFQEEVARRFHDRGIMAFLEFSRMVARFFIMAAVVLGSGYWAYGAYLLMSSGGDPNRLDVGREVFRRVLVGVGVCVSSYLIVSSVVGFYAVSLGEENVLGFTFKVSDDGGGRGADVTLLTQARFDELLDGYDIALYGEVIGFDSGSPVICAEELADYATERGWEHVEGEEDNWQVKLDGYCRRTVE